jgi:2-phospho-L-lactate/phosphoenolpyruvate guanylyltransferase
MRGIWAALPVKVFAGAKQRLSPLLSPAQRAGLAEAMLEDVLAALAAARLDGILVNTVEPRAAKLAERYHARVIGKDARSGHTAAVTAMARVLAREGCEGMLVVPADIPRATAIEIDAVLTAARPAPSFTISPAHDELGSNAVLCRPPEAVPLRFGHNSFFPHLEAARRQGVEPAIVPLPGIALDIDHPGDLRAFLAADPPMRTRTLDLLGEFGL